MAIEVGKYSLFTFLPVYMWNKYTGAFSETETFRDRKHLYRRRRDDFRSDERAMAELEQWKAKNCEYDYIRLTGMIPSKMVGKTNGGDIAFAKCDTWFSVCFSQEHFLRLHVPFSRLDKFQEFAAHNDKSLILSESAESYVIGNLASYDKRQYPQWFNPNHRPGINTPEGQGFGHCLVIPKRRIFNIVDPDAVANNASVIKEVRDHFRTFWDQGGSHKILQQTKASFDDQNAKLAAKDSTLDSYHKLLPMLKADYEKLSHAYSKLKADDFEYAFHPFPDTSVGHLHMHVFPKTSELRRFSTRQHDWKTIPIEAILEAEEEDRRAMEKVVEG
ncbi:MAG: hypothetical protein Q9217_002992 [Psora testacea]